MPPDGAVCSKDLPESCFVDDTFQAILSMNRPVPIAVKYLFDFLDELAEKHGIEDPETLHIWKTNRYLSC